MGKLRVLSGSEVCRILEQSGFAAVRQGGSHLIVQKRIEETTRLIGASPDQSRVAARSKRSRMPAHSGVSGGRWIAIQS